MEPFTRRPILGHIGNEQVDIKIKFDGKRLSITGDVHDNRSSSMFGQINLSIKPKDIKPLPSWNTPKIAYLWAIWDRWHLNDLRPRCEHQRNWDTSKELEIPVYIWTTAFYNIMQRAESGEMPTHEYELFRIISKRVHDTLFDNNREHVTELMEGNCIKIKETKKQKAGWTTQKEHPEGLLGKPCEICGYKYGSAWLLEPVPEEILEWLKKA